MSCTPETLASDSRCLANLSPHQLLAAWAYLVCNGIVPTENFRITEEDDPRITEEGDQRIVED